MKNIFIFLHVIICSNLSYGQGQIHFKNYVECVYDKTLNKPLEVYKSIEGEKIQELVFGGEYCWYKIVVEKSENGWLKIHKLVGVPDCSTEKEIFEQDFYKGYWVKAENFVIYSLFISTLKNTVKFYKKPNLESKIVVEIDSDTTYRILEIHNLWAKVSFNYKGKIYIGWINKEDQCANPWTAC